MTYDPARDAEILWQRARDQFGRYAPGALVENQPEARQAEVRQALGDELGDPIVALSDNGSLRTVLTDSHIVALPGKRRVVLRLAEMGDSFDVRDASGRGGEKMEMQCARFPGSRELFWAPSASEMSMLLSTLWIVRLRNGD